MTRTVEWANSWFLDPAAKAVVLPVQERRPWLFVATVGQLFAGVGGRAELKAIHNMLTLLLRGWNPVTADVEECVSTAEPVTPDEVFTESYKNAVKTLMCFETPPSCSAAIQLLSAFALIARQVGSKIQTTYYEERKTLMVLSLWLIARPAKLRIPNDIHLVRKCMQLYGRSATSPAADMMTEYCAGNIPLGWMDWVYNNTIYALSTGRPTKDVWLDIVYLAAFACLLQAHRCVANVSTDSQLDISKLLTDEVAKLRKFQEDYPMTLEVPEKASGFINVLGIKPKRKPPKIQQTNVGSN